MDVINARVIEKDKYHGEKEGVIKSLYVAQGSELVGVEFDDGSVDSYFLHEIENHKYEGYGLRLAKESDQNG